MHRLAKDDQGNYIIVDADGNQVGESFGSDYQAANKALTQINRQGGTGSLADAIAAEVIGGVTLSGKRPWKAVPDWELIAAYRSGGVVNGQKVTQAALLTELKERGATDEELTRAIKPGEDITGIEGGIKDLLSATTKGLTVAKKASSGGGGSGTAAAETKWTIADVKRLREEGTLPDDEAEAIIRSIMEGKDERLIQATIKDTSPPPAKRTPLDFLNQNAELTDLRSRIEAGKFGTGMQGVGSFGDEYPTVGSPQLQGGNYEGALLGATSPFGGGEQAGVPFMGGLQVNSGTSTQGFGPGSLAPSYMSRGDNLFSDSFYRRGQLGDVLGQRGLTGTGNMIDDFTALQQQNRLVAGIQGLVPGLDNASAFEAARDLLKLGPNRKKGVTDALNLASEEEEPLPMPYARGGLRMTNGPQMVTDIRTGRQALYGDNPGGAELVIPMNDPLRRGGGMRAPTPDVDPNSAYIDAGMVPPGTPFGPLSKQYGIPLSQYTSRYSREQADEQRAAEMTRAYQDMVRRAQIPGGLIPNFEMWRGPIVRDLSYSGRGVKERKGSSGSIVARPGSGRR